jgi:hypothetical protein
MGEIPKGYSQYIISGDGSTEKTVRKIKIKAGGGNDEKNPGSFGGTVGLYLNHHRL